MYRRAFVPGRPAHRSEDRIVSRSAGEPIAARAVAHGRALDCLPLAEPSPCTWRAFAIACGIDVSADAIQAAHKNAELNNVTNVQFREATYSMRCVRWK